MFNDEIPGSVITKIPINPTNTAIKGVSIEKWTKGYEAS